MDDHRSLGSSLELVLLHYGLYGSGYCLEEIERLKEKLPDSSPDWCEEACQITENIVNGCYKNVLERILETDAGAGEGDVDQHTEYSDRLKARVTSYLNNGDDPASHRQFRLLGLAVASLQLFMQINCTGPPSPPPTETLSGEDEDEAVASLSLDGEPAYLLTSNPSLLALAKACLAQPLTHCQSADWWTVRCLYVNQMLVAEKSPTVHQTAVAGIVENVFQEKSCPFLFQEENRDLRILFYLESSPICHFYYEYQKAKKCLSLASSLAGLQVSLSGALGKRTRFQETEHSQLLLKVETTAAPLTTGGGDPSPPLTAGGGDPSPPLTAGGGDPSPAREQLPYDLQLNDDTLLESVQYSDSADALSAGQPITALQQALVLGLCLEHKRSSPKLELLNEELMVYVNYVLCQPLTWSIQTTALMTRCLLQAGKPRTVERAMMQLQALVDQYGDHDRGHGETGSPATAAHRQVLLFASCPALKWKVESELAVLMKSLGAVTSALEVYLRLQDWQNAILCYQTLGRREKAEKLVREQLALKETPTLWCLLGDTLKDPDCYVKAWELSEQTSVRAQRSLGSYYLDLQQYQDSIQCFERAIKINSYQYSAWYLLGYAAMKTLNYQKAAKAYRHCVTLDTENFEAWNNLSTAYIRTDQKSRAFKTLQEALRCNFDHWKVWENYLLVSVDLGEFEEALQAYHRLLDLRDKHLDVDVLSALVQAMTSDLKDSVGNPASRLKKKVVELFGRLTSKSSSDPQVWHLYYQLHGSCQSREKEENEKALQCLQKAQRLQVQRSNWFKSAPTCLPALERTIELANAVLDTCQRLTDAREILRHLSSAKLAIRPVLTTVQREQRSMVDDKLNPELEQAVGQLDQLLQQVTLQIAQHN